MRLTRVRRASNAMRLQGLAELEGRTVGVEAEAARMVAVGQGETNPPRANYALPVRNMEREKGTKGERHEVGSASMQPCTY